MNKRQFLRQRRGSWRQFESLLNTLSGVSLKRMKAGEISVFSRLFRELSGDLATIRSRDWGQGLIDFLNALVARGHSAFYTAPPVDLAPVVRFLTADFPQLVRRRIGYFFVAAMLFFVPGALSWGVIQTNPSLATRLIDARQLEQFDEMYASEPSADDEDETAAPGWFRFSEERTAMAGFYVQHNVGIALQCFARGILFGVGTIYTLLYNGIAIGGVGGYVVAQGHGDRFLSFIISHGSFELTAIAIAGGAGLMLGDSLVHPGNRTRLEALRVQGLEAVQIAGGSAVMLIIAALIEGFWSPAPIPALVKYSVGVSLWMIVILYLSLAGRGR
ncbi:MAG: stage II sporulation protein M [Planctomycetaceae bacterium]